MYPKTLVSLIIASISCMNHVFAQAKLIEKIEKKGDELIIPYEKYELPNGLNLIIHEDHSDPMIHVDVTYHVGSAREELGKSGFAHFFEHMMFQGSGHVADEQHFHIVSEAGGTMNGSTTTDRTNYWETLPNNQLEVALWLESDRMGFLLDSVTQQKFEIQRATVKNERGQNYDNRPYGRVNEKICEAFYPYGHPYSWPTIGWMEDLNRADVNDLRNFFLRWYGPNNATLTVAGDVDVKEVIKLTEKYFGSFPRGPEVKRAEKPLVTLDKDRYISYEDNIRFPLIQMVFPTVPNYHPDEAPLDVLAEILGGGQSSIFYKNFIKAQKAMSASVSHPTQELGGKISISVRTFPNKTLSEMEQLIRESIAEFEKRGVTDDDLIRYKASYESSLINGSLATIKGKATMLATYEYLSGNPNGLPEELKRYAAVTKEDVMRVYNQYLKGKPAVILSVYPKGKPEVIAKPNNYTPPQRIVPPATNASTLTYNRPPEIFDRSRNPLAGANPVVKVPDYWTTVFANGLKVIGIQNKETPTVSIELSLEAGHKVEALDKTKVGISRLTASVWNEDTEKYTAEELSDMLERLGSSVSISSNNNYITISISSLLKNLDATLALADEKIFHPKFAQDDFERLKKEQLEQIANQATQPTTIADNIFRKLLYGKNHILGMSSLGTTETVNKISLEDVKAFYNKYATLSIANLVIVGDLDKQTILSKLGFLQKWKAKEVNIPEFPAVPTIEKTKIYLVNKDKAPQSEIRIGYIALPYDATGEFYKATVMNYPLGTAFNSRINLNLREDKGYTYGARSNFIGDKLAGPFEASAGVRANVTDSSVIEFMKEITKFNEQGITSQELEFTKKSIGQSDALRYEAPFQKAAFLKRIIVFNLDKTFVDKQNEILKNISKPEIDALAKKYLPFNKMVIVVVGDKTLVKDGLSKLGYEVVELNPDGEVVK